MRFISIPITVIALALAGVGVASAEVGTLRLSDFEARGTTVYPTGEGVQPTSGVQITAQQSKSGNQSVEVRYDFIANPKGLQYVGLGMAANLIGKPKSLSVWVYGDNSGEWLRLRLGDATGELFQWNLAPVTWQGWKQVSVDLGPTEPHWGGNDDGKLDYPLHFDSLLLDSNVKPRLGTIYVDDMEYVTEATPAEFIEVSIVDAPFGNVIWGDSASARPKVRIRNARVDQAFDGELRVDLVPAGLLPAPPPPPPPPGSPLAHLAPGQETLLPLDIPRDTDGMCRVAVTVGSAPRGTVRTFSLAVLQRPAPLTLMPDSPFGAQAHFGQGKGNNPETFKLMSKAGIKYFRDEISWGLVEQKKGQYTFDPRIDDWMRAAVANGVSPLILFDYGNGFYDGGASPTSPEAQAAFGEYCFQLVNHYKGQCHIWEVYNEPNIGFWVPKPDAVVYARLMKIAYAAAKRADPTCTVLGICTAGTDLTYMETVLKEGGANYMDAMSFHPYRYPGSPEKTGFVHEVQAAHKLMERYGIGDKPMWLTEIGWPTQKDPAGVTEQMSGNCLVRMYTQALTMPFVRTVVWYDFQDDGIDEKYNEMNFGLIRWNTFAPKANYISYKMLTQYLTGKKFTRQLLPVDEKDKRYCYEFSGPRGRVLVAWYDGGSGGATFRTGAKSVKLQYADGRRDERPTVGGDLGLSLTDMPVFIETGAQEAKVVASLLELKGDADSAMAGETLALKLVVRNPSQGELQGVASLTAPSGWEADVPGAKPKGGRLNVPVDLKTGAQQTMPVSLKVPQDAKDGNYPVSASFWGKRGEGVSEAGTTVEVSMPLAFSQEPPAFDPDGNVTQEVVVRNVRKRAVPDVTVTATPPEGVPIQPYGPAKPVTLKPGEATRLPITYKASDMPFATPFSASVMATPAGCKAYEYFPTLGAWALTRAATIPALDCDPAKWAGIPAIRMGGAAGGYYVLREGSSLKQKSAEIRLQWDEKALYVLAVVNDDKHVQPYHGAEVWQGDNIQLGVDARHTAWRGLAEGKTPPFAEIGLTRTDTGDEAYRWLWHAGACRGVALKTARVGNQTIYQAAIPWADLGPVVPKPGDAIGLGLLINANDGQGRDGWLEWFSGIGYGPKDPRKYGTFVLR